MSLIVPYKLEKLQAVFVIGDSMTGVNINDGYVAVLNPWLIQGNGIYVVSIENALLVKHDGFDSPGQAICLKRANPVYIPRRLTGYELESIRIAVRVVA